MRVVTSDSALAMIRERGGRLYVWVRKGRCCGAANLTLATASEAPRGKDFRRVEAAGFELFLPTHLGRTPDELHIDVRRFPRRVEAYWDGCIWVV